MGDRDGYVNYFTRNADGTLHAQPDLVAGGAAIDPGANSAPVMVDWNEDGLLDMVLGCEGTYPGGDPIRLYLNSGTAANYVFTTFSTVFCDDTDILLYRCVPEVYDLNGDGMKDLVIGDTDAKLWYCENDGSNAMPHFSTMVQVPRQNDFIEEYIDLRACVDDWNEDGTPDILTSDYYGNVNAYIAYQTGIEDGPGASPQQGSLSVQGSPTNGSFTLLFDLGAPSSARLDVYSQDGRLISSTALGEIPAGSSSVPVDISGNPSGVYLLVCSTAESTMHTRVVLTR